LNALLPQQSEVAPRGPRRFADDLGKAWNRRSRVANQLLEERGLGTVRFVAELPDQPPDLFGRGKRVETPGADF
jgi:hypothetical protein